VKMHVDYDWSVKKLAESPDDEECGAGVPLQFIGIDLASGPDETVCRLCEDCPPPGYPTDKTRCAECPRRAHPTTGEQK
jgi:hypothetical protein